MRENLAIGANHQSGQSSDHSVAPAFSSRSHDHPVHRYAIQPGDQQLSTPNKEAGLLQTPVDHRWQAAGRAEEHMLALLSLLHTEPGILGRRNLDDSPRHFAWLRRWGNN